MSSDHQGLLLRTRLKNNRNDLLTFRLKSWSDPRISHVQDKEYKKNGAGGSRDVIQFSRLDLSPVLETLDFQKSLMS